MIKWTLYINSGCIISQNFSHSKREKDDIIYKTKVNANVHPPHSLSTLLFSLILIFICWKWRNFMILPNVSFASNQNNFQKSYQWDINKLFIKSKLKIWFEFRSYSPKNWNNLDFFSVKDLFLIAFVKLDWKLEWGKYSQCENDLK